MPPCLDQTCMGRPPMGFSSCLNFACMCWMLVTALTAQCGGLECAAHVRFWTRTRKWRSSRGASRWALMACGSRSPCGCWAPARATAPSWVLPGRSFSASPQDMACACTGLGSMQAHRCALCGQGAGRCVHARCFQCAVQFGTGSFVALLGLHGQPAASARPPWARTRC